MDIGVRSAYVMSKYVVPIMVEQKHGLIIQTSSTGAHHYAFDVAYGVAHAGIDRLASDMALELKNHNVKAITLHPVGGCETEILSFPGGESTIFVGRAVAALAEQATDEDLSIYNGKVVITGELSGKYGFGHDDDPEGEMKTRKISEANTNPT
jgi:dehydrogenase/reductase SDR family protein 1